MSHATPVICPKCGHVRGPAESAPAWQCPACGIAYQKYRAYLESAKKKTHSIVTPPHAGEAARPAVLDGSVLSLVAANVFGLGVALSQGWDLALLMLLYWGQSVTIGIAALLRILALDRFKIEHESLNGRRIEPSRQEKWEFAFVFALFYGIMHAALLLILFAWSPHEPILTRWFWACTAVFALNHLWSYRYNLALDRQGTPNIYRLISIPYMRTLPPMMTLIIAAPFSTGTFALLILGFLKTLVDVWMHQEEHAQLQLERSEDASPD